MKKNTREKILAAAVEVFGDRGYRAATIREICKRAGVNQALVNYHFSSKKMLYDEIFSGIMQDIGKKFPVDKYIKDGMTKEEKLRGLVSLLMARAYGPDGLWMTKPSLKLLNREMLEPTDAMQTHIYTRVVEIRTNAESVVREFLKDDSRSEQEILLFVLSIIGQCMYPMFACEAMKAGGVVKDASAHFAALMEEHIYNFTLNALIQAGKKD